LTRFVSKPIYWRKNKHQIVFHYLLALADIITPAEAVSREAEPPEVDCPAVAPCSTIPRLVALPPDDPESATEAIPPPFTQVIATAGTTSAPPPLGWLNDTATSNPNRYLRRQAVIYPADDGWMAYTAVQSAQPVISQG
jgi:hypothetical protein